MQNSGHGSGRRCLSRELAVEIDVVVVAPTEMHFTPEITPVVIKVIVENPSEIKIWLFYVIIGSSVDETYIPLNLQDAARLLKL